MICKVKIIILNPLSPSYSMGQEKSIYVKYYKSFIHKWNIYTQKIAEIAKWKYKKLQVCFGNYQIVEFQKLICINYKENCSGHFDLAYSNFS